MRKVSEMDGSEAPEARPGEVAFTLSWQAADGALRGELEARNVSSHRVRLSGKPGLRPLGSDGRPLDTETVVTAELRLPGFVELAPGERARTWAGWGGWVGPPCSGRVIVSWQGGEDEAEVSGPRQPESRGPATNLSTSWFERVE